MSDANFPLTETGKWSMSLFSTVFTCIREQPDLTPVLRLVGKHPQKQRSQWQERNSRAKVDTGVVGAVTYREDQRRLPKGRGMQ